MGCSWDETYQNDLDNGIGQDAETDLTSLDSWFADVNAPAKVLDYLTSERFPLSPNNPNRQVADPSVLDLGCGNGSSLFELRLEGGYHGRMIGLDYSQQSVDLAKRLWDQHLKQQDGEEASNGSSISFERIDVLKDQPEENPWWPPGGFDLVLDKGTFDAVSLSAETMEAENEEVRIVEVYPAKVAQMVKSGGYLLITSVNWTEDEIVKWFTAGTGVGGALEMFGKINYPVYKFGGQTGQGVASVCFRRIRS